jgi:hypothetical protein
LGEKTEALSRVEQMELQELAHQQRRIQQQTADLMASLPSLMDKLPPDAAYDPLRQNVNDFIAAVAKAKIESDMADVNKSLADMDATTGYVLANIAAEEMDKLISKCNGLQQPGKQALCMKFQPKRIGSTLEQILTAMGVGQQPGNGQGDRDGYSMFNNDVALYGPDAERAGDQAGGRGDTGSASRQQAQRIAGDSNDPGLKTPDAPGRVKLQPNAKFPLRYRDLVGDYFRAIAESTEE